MNKRGDDEEWTRGLNFGLIWLEEILLYSRVLLELIHLLRHSNLDPVDDCAIPAKEDALALELGGSR